jgi:hypothetical protein
MRKGGAPTGAPPPPVAPPEEDLFRYAPLQAIASRRPVGEFGAGPVPREAITEAVRVALTAPVPQGAARHPPRWMFRHVHVPRSIMNGTASDPGHGTRRMDMPTLRRWIADAH